MRATHSSSQLEAELVYEGPDEAQARKALGHHLEMLQAEYAETVSREGGTLKTIVTYSNGRRRSSLVAQARFTLSGSNEDGWSRLVWTKRAKLA